MENYNFTIDNKPYEVTVIAIEGKNARVSVNGSEYKVDITAIPDLEMPSYVPVQKTQVTAPVQKPVAVQAAAKPVQDEKKAPEPVKKEQPVQKVAAGANSIVSPMPGAVFKILVAEGESIKSGDIVVTIEAMKMENQIRSTMDGKVAKIHVKEGEVVAEGAPLVSLG